MPPLLILALVGAVLALLAKDKSQLPLDQQKELEELQNQLAESRKSLRHAQNAKKRFVASMNAKTVEKGK